MAAVHSRSTYLKNKGKKTLFYNGEKIYYKCSELIYNKKERLSWEVIIALPGVEVIPRCTFLDCWNVKTVIMSDTVRRIEDDAFNACYILEHVKLSKNLE